jgi:hypothetical protein
MQVPKQKDVTSHFLHLFTAVAPHGDDCCNLSNKSLYALNPIWLPSDETAMNILVSICVLLTRLRAGRSGFVFRQGQGNDQPFRQAGSIERCNTLRQLQSY